jgi:hypothetical protein
MDINKRLIAALILSLPLTPWSALAQTSPQSAPPTIQEQGELAGQSQGSYEGNPYFSGGVGVEDRENIASTVQNKYNLKLEFARPNGAYLDHVKVHITDPQGRTVMDAVSVGPWFLTKLDPGTYKVSVHGFGQQFDRTVKVPAHGLQRVVFGGWKQAGVAIRPQQ